LEVTMLTILLIIVALLLLTGGIGYSRRGRHAYGFSRRGRRGT
jgi:hypothetical protein